MNTTNPSIVNNQSNNGMITTTNTTTANTNTNTTNNNNNNWRHEFTRDSRTQIFKAVFSSMKQQSTYQSWDEKKLQTYSLNKVCEIWKKATSKEEFLKLVDDLKNNPSISSLSTNTTNATNTTNVGIGTGGSATGTITANTTSVLDGGNNNNNGVMMGSNVVVNNNGMNNNVTIAMGNGINVVSGGGVVVGNTTTTIGNNNNPNGTTTTTIDNSKSLLTDPDKYWDLLDTLKPYQPLIRNEYIKGFEKKIHDIQQEITHLKSLPNMDNLQNKIKSLTESFTKYKNLITQFTYVEKFMNLPNREEQKKNYQPTEYGLKFLKSVIDNVKQQAEKEDLENKNNLQNNNTINSNNTKMNNNNNKLDEVLVKFISEKINENDIVTIFSKYSEGIDNYLFYNYDSYCTNMEMTSKKRNYKISNDLNFKNIKNKKNKMDNITIINNYLNKNIKLNILNEIKNDIKLLNKININKITNNNYDIILSIYSNEKGICTLPDLLINIYIINNEIYINKIIFQNNYPNNINYLYLQIKKCFDKYIYDLTSNDSIENIPYHQVNLNLDLILNYWLQSCKDVFNANL
ncbi:hypothetical protein ABK040_004971 [Willaertia magna]